MDLNSDVGESFGAWAMGDDDAVLGVVTSANVACGAHAGDPTTARRTCGRAAAGGVSVGAHVGYRDLAGFGRRFVDVDPGELTDDVIFQIGALQAVAAAAGTAVRYVKPHGALYNAIAHHRAQARAVVDAVRTVDPDLPVLVLPGSVVEAELEAAGMRPVREAFADRAYARDGTLVPRRHPGSVIDDAAVVAQRVVRLAADGEVVAADGTLVRIDAESLCVHGDTPGAVTLARAVRHALESAGIDVRPFR